jgi:hypothetical protein
LKVEGRRCTSIRREDRSMQIKNFTFNRTPSTGGLEILVRQNADNSPVIAELHVSEDNLYALLASLDLSAEPDDDDDDFDLEDEVEDEDDEEEEEA